MLALVQKTWAITWHNPSPLRLGSLAAREALLSARTLPRILLFCAKLQDALGSGQGKCSSEKKQTLLSAVDAGAALAALSQP